MLKAQANRNGRRSKMIRRYVVQKSNGGRPSAWIANADSDKPLTILPELAQRYRAREKARLAAFEAEAKHGGLFLYYREDADGAI